jgi:hypothetical protein
METFTTVLKHVAEPQTPDERDESDHTTLSDFQALWFVEALREYANYGDHDKDVQADIATAYVEFINKKIRDEGRRSVNLYAHTDVAVETLLDALLEYKEKVSVDDYARSVCQEVEDCVGELWIDVAGADEVGLTEDRWTFLPPCHSLDCNGRKYCRS